MDPDIRTTDAPSTARPASGSTTESIAPRADCARLTVVRNGTVERSQRISDDVVLGRGEDAQLFLADTEVSRAHARIRRAPIGFIIEDLGSRNGTRVNGVLVQRRKLEFGDRIQVGHTTIFFTPYDETEDQLAQLQRMEAMGRLVAGVAHDFNNLLSAIVSNLTFVAGLPRSMTIGDEEVRAGMLDARAAAERAVDIVAQLLSFARRGPVERRPTEIGPAIEELVRLVRRTFDKAISVEADLAPDLIAHVDPTELHQVLMNLCLNARDAMPDGGRLIVRTQPVSDSQAARCGINGPAVAIAVQDEGIGIDETTRARIFEPFFTSKALGRGTGLGLATVHGIVRAHGGTVLVDSAPGKGSTFTVLLPAASDPASPDKSVRETSSGKRRFRARVLIVDDDDLVRRGNGRLVKQLGCEVLYAASGEAAIETFESRRDIELVMMDLMMPGLNGEATYERLRAIEPGVRVLFVSGYYDQSHLSALARDTTCRVLHKPFDLAALERAIDASLATPADSERD